MNYYNTTQEALEQVEILNTKNINQDLIVLSIIKKINKPFSAKDIYKRFPVANVPMTSIRRSLNTLRDKMNLIDNVVINDKIVRVTGLYGRSETQYKLIN